MLSIRIMIMLFSVAILFFPLIVKADMPYPFHLGTPVETKYEDIPAISVKVHFDGFPLKPCEQCPGCAPPPVEFWIQIERQNPNSSTECWLRNFGLWGGWFGPFFRIEPWVFLGNGSAELLNPGQPGIDTCCRYPLK